MLTFYLIKALPEVLASFIIPYVTKKTISKIIIDSTMDIVSKEFNTRKKVLDNSIIGKFVNGVDKGIVAVKNTIKDTTIPKVKNDVRPKLALCQSIMFVFQETGDRRFLNRLVEYGCLSEEDVRELLE